MWREEGIAFTGAMTNFHSLSKSTVVCAVLHEQDIFQKCLDKFFSGYFFQFAIIFSGKIRLNRFYADIKTSVIVVINQFFCCIWQLFLVSEKKAR